mmetsp:Transcript_14047/g.21926  ORF Transcript_14047/g.21926 Transcript_14047/m.21926 type:complete len:471 (+) Transcript_14047:43-1455(+)|eukprot:CAMPEP_0195297548 /NCGR_PEP_ID=MMETSP0707-20130614/21740_1 /TAXON_ID=33640 /ORGANISM="Asterionellopsis glacialis, Strain CCMP134" /LENGTH=470 /DNA_ID=CAMNT_0040359391 /DNA_START=42 /DNA_END=1454 /DNA_ORIENTATION=-
MSELSSVAKKNSSHSKLSSKENEESDGDSDGVVKESTIRKMTRLAMQHNAVNLSQGFPNESPPEQVRLALAYGVLTGHGIDCKSTTTTPTSDHLRRLLLDHIQQLSDATADKNGTDELNQYSPPMGRMDVRTAIVDHYKRLYNFGGGLSPEMNVTVTLGATEAVASALRTLGCPGDKVVIFEPFHELYPSQCQIFHLQPTFVTLYPTTKSSWEFHEDELEEALSDAKILLLNTPHNPTGKVFTRDELEYIVNLCLKYKVFIMTDEIYEWMCYSTQNDDGRTDDHHGHLLIPQEFPQAKDITFICNSIGKSASATGWRVGWCIHPSKFCHKYRGIHDQLVVMAPQPMQYATLTYFTALPDSYFLEELSTKYYQRMYDLSKILQELGFDVIFPQGAYYLFVKYGNVPWLQQFREPMDAAMYLLREVGVACVPGDNFYGKNLEEGRKFLRFAACRSLEDLAEAGNRLRKMRTT